MEFGDLHYTPLDKIEKAAADTKRREKYPQIYLENPNIWELGNGADMGARCLGAGD